MRPPPTTPRLFVLERLPGVGPDMSLTQMEPVNYGAARQCPRCGALLGTLPWLPPYRVRLEPRGEDYADFVVSGGTLLMTERFARAFRAEGLTGLEGFHPVEVVRVRRGGRRELRPGPPPPYLVVTVAPSSAAPDEARSRIVRYKPVECPECRSGMVEAIDGFTLEAGSWGGEDVFQARGLGAPLLVTERFVRLAERHALGHLAPVPTDKYVYDPLRRLYPAVERERRLQA
jgi:hypothetical protein